MKKLSSLSLLLFICLAAKSQTKIDIKNSYKHIGDTVTICDSVYSTRALGSLTLINLGAAFTKQLLTVVFIK
ncbi:MAG: hypothetical protein EOO47_23785 [Flavobacterium sp.]|nr:MAG: hypothetical protein EOO47_23785 [Flavobacterium sp.]